MAKRPVLKVDKRTLSGRKVKLLRREGFVPANIFGKKTKSLAVQVSSLEFNKLYKEIGETTLLDLQVAGEKASRPVLIADIQQHPVTNHILHIDFHEVALTEKVTATIPVELIGEAPAVKEQGGILVHPVSEIDVEALPTDLPDKFEIDISKLVNIGDAFTLEHLAYDKTKVTITLDPSTVLVTIQAPKEEVEEAPPAPETPAEAPAETVEGKPEEAKTTADAPKADAPKSTG